MVWQASVVNMCLMFLMWKRLTLAVLHLVTMCFLHDRFSSRWVPRYLMQSDLLISLLLTDVSWWFYGSCLLELKKINSVTIIHFNCIWFIHFLILVAHVSTLDIVLIFKLWSMWCPWNSFMTPWSSAYPWISITKWGGTAGQPPPFQQCRPEREWDHSRILVEQRSRGFFPWNMHLPYTLWNFWVSGMYQTELGHFLLFQIYNPEDLF